MSGAEEVETLFEILGGVDPRRYELIRPEIKAAIDDYANHGRRLGSFLTAVLSNDLMEAVARADYGNLHAIGAICRYVYNEIPAPCCGSAEAVEAWIKGHADEKGAG